MDINIKEMGPYQVAYISQKGSFDLIPEVLGKVVGWLMVSNVEIRMPIYGTYYNSPYDVEEKDLEWEVGAAFVGELTEEDDIKIKNVPQHHIISTIFKGPYGEASSVYRGLLEYAMQKGYEIVGPVTESYLNSPEFVEESELLTEVSFPIKK
jgi:effector-binding domain-containing protein